MPGNYLWLPNILGPSALYLLARDFTTLPIFYIDRSGNNPVKRTWETWPLMSYYNSILLAEDDDDDCMFFESALREINPALKFMRYPDGTKLMSEIDSVQNPGILFLDINMPKINGLECLAELRNQTKYKDLPILIFSTFASPDLVGRLYDAGASSFIVKPNDFDHWRSIIEKSITTDWKAISNRNVDDFVANRIIQ
jgi:CheY-like chemotaxis protein